MHMFYVLCSLYAPIYQEKFQVGVNLLGNKYILILILILILIQGEYGYFTHHNLERISRGT